MSSLNLTLLQSLKKDNHYIKKTYDIEEFEIKNERYSKSVFYIQRGCVTVYKINDKGEKQFIILLTKNQTYGGHFCSDSQKECSYVKILMDNTVVYEFPMAAINNLIKGNYYYQKDLFQLWNEQYSIFEKRSKLLKIRSVPLRLRVFLYDLNEQIGEKYNESGDRVMKKIFSQDEISHYIGTNRITVNSIVTYLKSNQLIDCCDGKIILRKAFFDYCKNNIYTSDRIENPAQA